MLPVLALILTVLALSIAPTTAFAADPTVTTLRLDMPDKLTVGDRFRIVINVEADAGTTVALAPDGLPDALSLTATPVVQSKATSSGRIAVTLTLEVAAFVQGDLQLDPLKLSYRGPGGASGTIETRPSRITIDSVLPPSGIVPPRDLKPQAEIGSATPSYVAPAIGVLAIVLLSAGGFVLWRKRRRAQPAGVLVEGFEAEAVSAEDEARRALDGIVPSLRAGEYVEYYATLSLTVRRFLTERFGFPAFALTTSELQEQMVRRGMDRWQARLVGGLLNQCDTVVYAQYRPAPERADADLTAAYEIVEMTRPEAVEPVPVGAP